MKNVREIIIAPLFSEKTNDLKENKNVYSFRVSINANKIEIKKAIEKIFEVDVTSVNTIQMMGKPKRQGRWAGFKPDWKKAYVTVKTGQSIADFDM
jgi:large subunit ribosomal protein L23